MSQSAWRLPGPGTNIAVVADCHAEDGRFCGLDLLLPRLQSADLIVTLGGVEAAVLDRLQDIAPLLGVARPTDPDDRRTRRSSLILHGDGYSLGCIATLAQVPATAESFDEASIGAFGRPLHLLLHASPGMPAHEVTFAGKAPCSTRAAYPKGRTALAPASCASRSALMAAMVRSST